MSPGEAGEQRWCHATVAMANRDRISLGQQTRQWARLAGAVIGVGMLLLVCQDGIGIGYSNHSGLIPVVRRLIDPQYLPGDFGIATRLFHHRPYAEAVAALARFVGEDGALIGLAVAGKMLLALSLMVLARALGLGTWGYVVVGALIAAEIAYVGRGLESNTLVGDSAIMPPPFAHAFALLAIASLIRSRYRAGAFFAGVSLLFHLQIGLILGLLLAPFYLSRFLVEPREMGPTIALFLLPAAPALFFLLQMVSSGLAGSTWTLEYIRFRHPHHFELRSTARAVAAAVFLMVQWIAYRRIQRLGLPEARGVKILATISSLIAGLALMHFLDYHLIQSGTVAKLQFIRWTPFISVFGALSTVLLAQLAWRGLPEARRRTVFRGAAVLMAAIAIGHSAAVGKLSFRVHRYAEESTAWAEVCRWIKTNTPKSAVFLTPPGNDGFVYLAGRSAVVEFRTNPDGGLLLAEWYARLRDLGGGSLPDERGLRNAKRLNEAYAALPEDVLRALGEKYGADYAVMPLRPVSGLNVMYRNDAYQVARLRPDSSAGTARATALTCDNMTGSRRIC
jgi:hypothetical protein